MLFCLPIGDISLDGHEIVENIVCRTNRNLAATRDAYMKIQECTGISPRELCKNDDSIDVKTAHAIESLGCTVTSRPHIIAGQNKFSGLTVDDVADILLFLMNHVSPGLHVRQDPPESIDFSGYDSKHRSFEAAGYGLFNMN